MDSKHVSASAAAILWVACILGILWTGYSYFTNHIRDIPVVGGVFAEQASTQIGFIVLALFSWILVDLGLHARLVSIEKRDVRTFVRQVAISSPGQKFFSEISGGNRAARRAQFISRTMREGGDVRSAIEAWCAVDSNSLDDEYSALKAYTWILPVVGFIGTALGMSEAISGFSRALIEGRGGTGQVQVITDRLSQLVIPGLAGAFAITMLALGASLVSHFCITQLQSWDADVLEELDRGSIELMAKMTPPAQSPARAPIDLTVMSRIATTLEEIKAQLTSDLAERFMACAKDLSEAAGDLKDAAHEVVTAQSKPYNVKITRDFQ